MKYLMVLSVLTVIFCMEGSAESFSNKSLIVAVKQSPPFAIKHDENAWSGLAVDLWDDIAEELGLKYEFKEMTLEMILNNLADGSVDAAVGAFTVTAERARVFDFTHPFYISGLGIAVQYTQRKEWLNTIASFFSYKFLSAVAVLMLVLLLAGVAVWFFENKDNPDQFGSGWLRGIGSSLWWSAVTMTTVGYGDKAPKTFWGRSVAIIWMFTAVIIISGFTAAITTALTVSRLESKIKGPNDLPNVRVATSPKSTSENYLHKYHISYLLYDTPRDGLEALVRDEIDAFVYDSPIIRYLASNELKGKVQILAKIFNRQDYAFAFPENSDLRIAVNLLLLEKIHDPKWQDILYEYLGAGSFY